MANREFFRLLNFLFGLVGCVGVVIASITNAQQKNPDLNAPPPSTQHQHSQTDNLNKSTPIVLHPGETPVAGQTYVLYSENFDGVVSGDWDSFNWHWVVDTATWWLSSRYTPFNGTYSLWCAELYGNGTTYSDDMLSDMYRLAPIDIRNYASVQLRYYMRCVTANDGLANTSDWGTDMISDDGISYSAVVVGDGGCGHLSSHYNYSQRVTNIPFYYNDLYIGFRFSSDATNHAYVGANVDAITVTGTYVPPPQPNLKPGQPPGWDSPLILSMTAGTNQSTSIVAGETAYLDWAVEETQGVDISTPFQVGLYLDNNSTPFRTWQIDGIRGLRDSFRVDEAITFSSGSTGNHQLKLRVDYTNSIAESNESDNEYIKNVTFLAPYVSYTGDVRFSDPRSANSNPFVRYAVIQLWDDDFPYPNRLLAQTTTTSTGWFTFGPISNVEADYRLDPYFIVYAENSAAWATVNDSISQTRYVFQTLFEENVHSGDYNDTIISIDQGSSGPFNLVDAALTAREKWLATRSANIPPKIRIVSKAVGGGTYYRPSSQIMFIDGSDDPLLFKPDTYDDDAIWHEYGHVIQFSQSFFNKTTPQSHSWNLPMSDQSSATAEAFAHWFSCWVKGNPERRSYGPQGFSGYYFRNLENGTYGIGAPDTVYGSANNRGMYWEGAIACLLWDILDPVNDDVSSPANGLSWPHNADGIGDSLTSTASTILATLMDKPPSGTQRPDSMYDFWTNWFRAPSNAHLRALRDIYYEHGDTVTCCAGIRGNVDYDNNDAVNIVDVNALSAYLFEGAILKCKTEANLDAVSIVNVVDLSYLINYLFKGGPPPVSCPY